MDIVTLLGLTAALIAIIEFLYISFKKFKRPREVRIYDTSSSSDGDMYADLNGACNLSFYGLELKTMAQILGNTLNGNGLSKALNIKIYYAKLDDGKIWLGERFRPSVLESLKDVAALVSSQSFKSKTRIDLKVDAYIRSHHTTYAGCSIDKKIIYVVHFTSGDDVGNKDGVTLRLHAVSSGEFERKLFRTYISSHEKTESKAIRFVGFRRTVWDESTTQWKKFTDNCEAHQENMAKLATSLSLNDGMNVLELASGNGMLASLIGDQNAHVCLFLTDNSGQMIKSCTHAINNISASVLFFDPLENGHNWQEFFPENTCFDRIVSHLSFPFPEMRFEDFHRIIDFMRTALRNDGSVHISIHNTAIQIEGDAYNKESDEFRAALISAFQDKFGVSILKYCQHKTISVADFEAAFLQKGFLVSSSRLEEYAFTMHDRIRMWSTPAILNSLFHIEKCNLDHVAEIMDKMLRRFGNEETLPMKTVTYVFSKSSNGVHNNAIH